MRIERRFYVIGRLDSNTRSLISNAPSTTCFLGIDKPFPGIASGAKLRTDPAAAPTHSNL